MSVNSCRTYLSVQLMQGSMVRIIMGTLARSALQRMRQTCQVLRRRRAYAKTVQILGTVTAHIVICLAARLLNHSLAARAVWRRKLGAPADTVVPESCPQAP